MNVSHTELEQCRTNPRKWIQGKAGPAAIYSFGYNQALIHAIHRYHKTGNDANQATAYLQLKINQHFTNQKRSEQIERWLERYIDWCEKSGVTVADSKFRIKLQLNVMLELRGEVHRLDILPDGYRAVLLGSFLSGWKSELRMPLLQKAVAIRYGRPAQKTIVATQALDGSNLSTTKFSVSDIALAEGAFRKLSATVQQYAASYPGLLP